MIYSVFFFIELKVFVNLTYLFFNFMHAERLSIYEWAKGLKALELDPILESTTLTRL